MLPCQAPGRGPYLIQPESNRVQFRLRDLHGVHKHMRVLNDEQRGVVRRRGVAPKYRLPLPLSADQRQVPSPSSPRRPDVFPGTDNITFHRQSSTSMRASVNSDDLHRSSGKENPLRNDTIPPMRAAYSLRSTPGLRAEHPLFSTPCLGLSCYRSSIVNPPS